MLIGKCMAEICTYVYTECTHDYSTDLVITTTMTIRRKATLVFLALRIVRRGDSERDSLGVRDQFQFSCRLGNTSSSRPPALSPARLWWLQLHSGDQRARSEVFNWFYRYCRNVLEAYLEVYLVFGSPCHGPCSNKARFWCSLL